MEQLHSILGTFVPQLGSHVPESSGEVAYRCGVMQMTLYVRYTEGRVLLVSQDILTLHVLQRALVKAMRQASLTVSGWRSYLDRSSVQACVARMWPRIEGVCQQFGDEKVVDLVGQMIASSDSAIAAAPSADGDDVADAGHVGDVVAPAYRALHARRSGGGGEASTGPLGDKETLQQRVGMLEGWVLAFVTASLFLQGKSVSSIVKQGVTVLWTVLCNRNGDGSADTERQRERLLTPSARSGFLTDIALGEFDNGVDETS